MGKDQAAFVADRDIGGGRGLRRRLRGTEQAVSEVTAMLSGFAAGAWVCSASLVAGNRSRCRGQQDRRDYKSHGPCKQAVRRVPEINLVRVQVDPSGAQTASDVATDRGRKNFNHRQPD